MSFKINKKNKNEIIRNLSFLYGKKEAFSTYKGLEKIIKKYAKKIKKEKIKNYFDEKDIILITYGDNIKDGKTTLLQALRSFLVKNLKGIINTVHIIGLFLYSSDRGFSIIDYKKINTRLGNSKDLKEIEQSFNLMIDFVCNHISSRSNWFRYFKEGNKNYQNFFITFDKKPNENQLKKIFRPRTSSLLIYKNINNKGKWLWRTFCHDQIDLNYKNPKVLLKMIDVFLFYLENKAKFIRLDAIGFIWKDLGTNCFLLPESHIFVRILRNILDVLSPSTSLIAEINTKFKDNITYLGNGENEAQLIYNFPLPVMVLNTFYQKDTNSLLRWLKRIKLPSKKTALINILDCHDGLSVLGAIDILTPEKIKNIEKEILKRNGKIGYREYKKKILPYEFNITWWSALNGKSKESEKLKIKKYLATRAIQFSLKGIPAIYFLGLFGIENCISCFNKTKKPRDINRKTFSKRQIDLFLKNKDCKEYKVFEGICFLLKKRNSEKAFHPSGDQKILFIKKTLFSIIRTSTDKKENILVLVNVSKKTENIKLNPRKLNKKTEKLLDILSKENLHKEKNKFLIKLQPYQIRWLKY